MAGPGKKALLFVFALLCGFAAAGPACAGGSPAGKFYTSGDAKKPFFALTFDDGPGYITPDLLKLLDKYGAKASFFMLGSSVRARPAAALAVVKAGHLACNHTYSHKSYHKLNKGTDREKILTGEILAGRSEIEKATGERPVFLRMPNGYYHAWVAKVAAETGCALINWTYGSDWTALAEQEMTRQYLENLKPGAILLFHDGGGRKREKTLRVVEKVLSEAKKLGLTPVRLDGERFLIAQ